MFHNIFFSIFITFVHFETCKCVLNWKKIVLLTFDFSQFDLPGISGHFIEDLVRLRQKTLEISFCY